ENYRRKIYAPLGGKRAVAARAEVREFIALATARVQSGLDRAEAMADGWMPTYLRFTADAYEILQENGAPKTKNGMPCVKVTAFSGRALPHFAEGVAKGIANGRTDLYRKAKQSQLYDPVLGVYRTSEPLDGETLEIGRIRSFPKGWLERESCFLHMNYKLLLSLLHAGMYDEFFREMRANFVPFFKPGTYGRSTIENSSFIVTSNHCDKKKWGKGFQARLTGANAEALSMWRVLMGVQTPFTVRDGQLRFALQPVLTPDFFDKEGKVTFTLFGNTRITYRMREKKPTYKARIAQYHLRGEDNVNVATSTVAGELAERIRAGKISEIEVNLE
ncbi:MAG: hypothetical protein K2L51_01590, partial [Clostridiales bacterium]|nr:hypothetical protein [Clostridiales bacterium]